MEKHRDILKIIIHCSDSPDNLDIGFKQINDWHKERGFEGVDVQVESKAGSTLKRIYCGYHYVVRRNGVVETGRPEKLIGAHCYMHNANSIGICWAGRFSPTNVQRDALVQLVKTICLKYALPYHRVYGHKEFNKEKTCPNIDMDLFRQDIQKLLAGESNGSGDLGPK